MGHCRSERGDVKARNYEIVSFGHDGTVMLMNFEMLWLPAQDLYKTKSVNVPGWIGEEAHESLPLAEESLTVDGC